MSLYLDPTGEPTYGIGICARCSRKFLLADLHPDPNSPGLMVCLEDLDEFDPWRLPALQPDTIVLPFTRPDEPLLVAYAPDPFYGLATESNPNIFILTETGRILEAEGTTV